MGRKEVFKYRPPENWLAYDGTALSGRIAAAEDAMFRLASVPYRCEWLNVLQRQEMHAEVAGTCRLAGLDIRDDTPVDAGGPYTHLVSVEGVGAVRNTADAYEWLATLPKTTPFDLGLVRAVHARLVAGDASTPLRFRQKSEQILFGEPIRRGAKGGKQCVRNVARLLEALVRSTAPAVVKGLALHYHLLMIRPFPHANGRTARALEALYRHTSGLSGRFSVSMAGFYSTERTGYHEALNVAWMGGHDLTPFLDFALVGLSRQCGLVLEQVHKHLATMLFNRTLEELFGRLQNGKRRAMAERQMGLLRTILAQPDAVHVELFRRMQPSYDLLKNPWKAFLRDLHDLVEIQAVEIRPAHEPTVSPLLDWPSVITEEAFFQHYRDTLRSGIALSAAV